MAIMDDETLQMYIEESKEHLESIEGDLLEIEQGGENIDEDLVNKVFRAAHSVKGGAGFIGLDTIKDLSHKIENVLDMVRNYQLTPNPELINIVLVAFDRLGELLDDAVNSNEEDVSEHIVALKGIVAGSLNDDEKGSVENVAQVAVSDGGPYFEVSEFDLKQAVRGGKCLYVLAYDLIGDVQKKNKTPMDVIKGLNDGGVILDTHISIEMVGDLDSEKISSSLPMHVLYSSIIEPDLVGMMMGLDQDQITVVSVDDLGSSKFIKVVEGDNQPEKQKEQTPGSGASSSETEKESLVLEKKEDVQNPKPTSSLAKSVEQEKAAPQKSSGKAKPAKKNGGKITSKADSLRVPVAVLDQLMNRAGELVLARNELLQSIAGGDKKSMTVAGQRVDLVTSELQEAIMLTRMQPVGNIFSKFPRVVRDLSRDLGKEMALTLEGKEVELDKTIIEGLGDPLTHLVRNSCDHGIELPGDRLDKGKQSEGSIFLRAFHESGQVIIEIEDDGKGLDAESLALKAIEKGLVTEEQVESMSDKEKTALIMLPGFSTADQVTEVSGRGVGMDVVKTNLDNLGGQVELISQVDKGTVVRIKLPLTLAIIPSLLVSSCGERFALPQINVGELLRVHASEIQEKIEKVGGADVLILRGELIPLLQLNNVLGLRQTFYDQKAGEFKEDRRTSLADERLTSDEQHEQSEQTETDAQIVDQQKMEERRDRNSNISIVVLQAGNFKYGLVVEEVHDTVEIVVKPLGRHLHQCAVYAGATIMGDGHVALILDVAGLAKVAELRTPAEAAATTATKTTSRKNGATRQTLLLFHNGTQEYCAVPLHLVLRVEQIQAKNIEIKGGKKVIQYRGGSLPIFALEEVANVEMLEEREALTVIIFVVAGREVGLLAVPPLDVIEEDLVIDEETLRQPGISGSAIIREQTTLMVDIFGFMQALSPEWFENRTDTTHADMNNLGTDKPILLAEDSDFFRDQITNFFESEGYAVIGVEDGIQAWDYLSANPEQVGLVVTDIEMPNMDGFELAKKIKADQRFVDMKIIALTSLAGEEDINKGREVGIDDYQVKLDKEKLMQGIHRLLQ